MIFVTVGSRPYPFDRLFRKLDELYENGTLKDEMFAQIGTSSYIPRHYCYQDFLDSDEFIKRINQADIVVSHGASGSIMKALYASKPVIAVTRLEKYGEHINDHQIQNNRAFSENGYVIPVYDMEELGAAFQCFYEGTAELRPWENKAPMAVIDLIDQFIQDNWKGTIK